MVLDLTRFFTLRQRIFDLIRAVDEGYHKSYEGALDIVLSFPDYFTSEGTPEIPEVCRIELHCYLLCDGRHQEFVDHTFDGCLDRLEVQIKAWERRIVSNKPWWNDAYEDDLR